MMGLGQGQGLGGSSTCCAVCAQVCGRVSPPALLEGPSQLTPHPPLYPAASILQTYFIIHPTYSFSLHHLR